MQEGSTRNIGYYAVCLVDVLGQGDALNGWAILPQDGKPTVEIIQSLKRSYGTITGLSEAFANYYGSASKPSPRIATQGVPPETIAVANRLRDCDLCIERFSDTFLFFAPLRNSHGDLTVEPFYRMLGACCTVLLISFAAKTALRGSLVIGTGTVLDDNRFYGPAMAQGHHIESRVAEYPRIVVSREAVEYLNRQGGFSADPKIEKVSAEISKHWRSLVCIDSDGHSIVDWLGQGMKAIHGNGHQVPFMVNSAQEFVSSELNRFSSGNNENEKLAKKYSRLNEYISARIALWK